MCAPVVNRDVNQLELGRRPWSSPTLDLERRFRVEEREVDPESGDYGYGTYVKRLMKGPLGSLSCFLSPPRRFFPTWPVELPVDLLSLGHEQCILLKG